MFNPLNKPILKNCPFCNGVARVVINNINPESENGKLYSSSVHIACGVLDSKDTCGVRNGYQFFQPGKLVDDTMLRRAAVIWNYRV